MHSLETEEREAAEEKARLAREQQEADLREVLRLPAGRRFVAQLLANGRLAAPSYTGDAIATAYNEGQRSVAVGLWRQARKLAPLEFPALAQELFGRAAE